jgi:hypothetical protein
MLKIISKTVNVSSAGRIAQFGQPGTGSYLRLHRAKEIMALDMARASSLRLTAL